MTNISEFAAQLTEALWTADEQDGPFQSEVVSVSTFDEAGLLTNNDGLVVRFADGTSYQLTVVQAS